LEIIILSDVSSYSHQAVSIVYFDIFLRYSRLLTYNPKLIKKIETFVDKRGIKSENPIIRKKASFNFKKIVF
jgi:hypothetical protein